MPATPRFAPGSMEIYSGLFRSVTGVATASAVLLLLAQAASAAPCVADEDVDGSTTVDELTTLALDTDEADVLAQALGSALHGCGDDASQACNGANRLCQRRYDEVAYATTHNAMANAEDGFQGPNQRRRIAVQLVDGIRGLMLDVHLYAGRPHLCHAECELLGRRPLADGLTEIRAFLLSHPREVVTLILESYVAAADIAAEMAATGLLDFVHTQELGRAWPSLEEMVTSGRRLVVLSDRRTSPETYPWHHYVWDYAVETPFSFRRAEEFTCSPNRGSPGNDLFILNHFLTDSIGQVRLARQVNFDPLLSERLQGCTEVAEQQPNFVAVDFYDIGDVLSVVRTANR